jgi:hypothetical protein
MLGCKTAIMFYRTSAVGYLFAYREDVNMFAVRRLHRVTLPLAILALLMTATSGWPQSPAQKADPKELVEKMRQLKEAAKKEHEAAIQKLKAKIAPLMQHSIEELRLALTITVTTTYGAAKVIADDDEHTYLGQIDHELSSDSIFNDYGTYGSKSGSDSIWNKYGQFGGEYSSHSPLNKYSSTPPLILKNGRVIGRLTVNKHVAGAVDPNWLKAHFTY